MRKLPLPKYAIIPISKVRKGTKLICDDGFTCMNDQARKTVRRDKDGLYVLCSEGHHYLDSQITGKNYVGFWKAKP